MAKTATDPGYAACPIRNIVDRFGDKWSLLVLYNLHTGGRLRFSEIHRRMTDISQKMLASTLRRLEQDGLLSAETQEFPDAPLTEPVVEPIPTESPPDEGAQDEDVPSEEYTEFLQALNESPAHEDPAACSI